ncbi:MAG: AAA family ATPase [Clostridia bacterium]|nr:AAA family ATPase [Clostridia bacterium]
MLDVIRKGLLENGIVVKNNVHVAIVNEPFLGYIKNGKKTIESRFTKNKIAPYCQISEDDIVCMKAAGRPIDSIFIVEKAQFYENSPNTIRKIKKDFSEQICAFDDTFWETRECKKFISLIGIKEVINLKKPFNIPKKDKRGWIRFESIIPKDIFLIAGKIGSGKTYWADCLAKQFNCARSSFSSYIKNFCDINGIVCSRENMQNIGSNIIKNELDNYLYYTLLYNSKDKNRIFVDGLRHEVVYNRIKELFPKTNVVVIYIECSEDQRKNNILSRGSEYIKNADESLMEKGAICLKEKADYVIHYEDNPEDVFKSILPLFSSYSLLDIN